MLFQRSLPRAGNAIPDATAKAVAPAPRAVATPLRQTAGFGSATAPTLNVRTYAYDDYGRKGSRGGKGDRRKGGKKYDDDDDWDETQAEDVTMFEEVSISGMTQASPAAQEPAPRASSSNAYNGGNGYNNGYNNGYGSSGSGNGYRQRDGEGYGGEERQYGQRQGRGGYGRRGGGGGGRGYGRGRWGGQGEGGAGQYGAEGQQQDQQQGGQQGGQWRGEGGQWREGGQRGEGGQWRGEGGQWREGGRGGRNSGGGGRGGGRIFRGPREAMSPEQLEARQANNDAIRGAADWRVLAALLEERGSNFDAENIVTMLHRVAKEPRPTTAEDTAAFEGLVASLYGWVSALMPALRPRHCAMSLWSVARLELFNEELVVALTKRAEEQMGNFNEWEAANTIWAYGKMNYSPGEEWLNKFVFWTERRLQGYKPVELSNTINALAKLGHMPSATWLDALTAAAAKSAGDFNNLEYVNLMFGLASLGFTGGADPASWLEPLTGGPGGASRAESLRAADLTRVAWALTQFEGAGGWRPGEEWLAAACKSFIRQLRYCLPSDLATTCYSLAYLRAQPRPDDLRLLSDQLSRQWQRLTGDELANVAMSLALWQYRPPSDRWLDELVITTKDKLPSCSADALSKIVSALPLLAGDTGAQGYRLAQVVAQAQAMLDGAAQGADGAQAGEAAAAEPMVAAA